MGDVGMDGDRRMVTLSYSIGRSPFRDGSRETRIVSSRSRGHVRYMYCDPRTYFVNFMRMYVLDESPSDSRRYLFEGNMGRVFSRLYKNPCPKKKNEKIHKNIEIPES